MTHGVEDRRCQLHIVGRLREAQRLHEVALRKTMTARVVRHPRGEQGSFRRRCEQLASVLVGVRAAE